MGDKALDWRFELGEEVMAWIVIREVYGLSEPRSPESLSANITFECTAFAALAGLRRAVGMRGPFG